MIASLIILLIVFSPGTYRWLVSSFKPVIYALVIAYLLDSLVMLFIKKLKVNRVQGILLSCLIVLGLLGFSVYKILPQIVDNISNIMSFIMYGDVDIAQIVTEIKNKIDNRYIQYITDYILHASESIRDIINSLLIQLYNIVMLPIFEISDITIIYNIVMSLISAQAH